MKAQTFSKNVIVSTMVALLFLFTALVLATPQTQTAGRQLGEAVDQAQAGRVTQNIPQPRLDAPLAYLVGSTTIALATTKTHTSTPMRVLNLDEPPRDICGTIEKLTGKPCVPEVNRLVARGSGVVTIQVVLRSGNQVFAELQAMPMKLSEILPSRLGQIQGQETAWVSAIKVVDWANGNGLGRWVWQAGDKAIAAFTGKPQLYVFVDAAGWGKALMKGVEVVREESGYWVYWIRP